MSKKKIALAVGAVLLLFALAGGYIARQKAEAPQSTEQKNSKTQTKDSANQNVPVGFDKTKYSIDTPGSPWWIVNKNRPLPDGYVPPDLVVPNVRLRLAKTQEQMQFSKQAEPALIAMFGAAAQESAPLVFGSGYRSEALQKQFYDSYVAKDGQAAADRYSARPGTSEHQTGLAFDVTAPNGKCHLEICFVDTPEGQWVKNNSYKYGFVVRYVSPEKEAITGYQYEPWHLRYVGIELASELQKTGQTMEEFFGLN